MQFLPPLLIALFLSVINQKMRIFSEGCCEKGKPVARRGRKI